MVALLWKLAYVRRALASRYEITRREAWADAHASWQEWNSERGRNPLLPVSEAFRQDAIEWGGL